MKVVKWLVAGFIGLVVLGAIIGPEEEKKGDDAKASAASAPAEAREVSETTEAAPALEPEPEEIAVDVTGPQEARTDQVTLRGEVNFNDVKVRIDGERATVKGHKWKKVVTLGKKGDNDFDVVATRKGFVKATTTATVTRKLSAAEKAVARRERAERRANARALEAAENYLDMSGFSKQGLYEQLSSDAGEGFSASEAQYAVDHVDANWKQEAVESARNYLDMSPMSKQALIEQLTSSAGEKFTYEQAVYAVNKVY